MIRNKKIILNKLTGAMKEFPDNFEDFELKVNDYSGEIILNTSFLNWSLIEPLTQYMIKGNINWSIKFLNGKTYIKITI